MNKKWLATTLCAAGLFATSFTAADAASLNKEVKNEVQPQYVQIIKGENYQGFAINIIDQICLPNGDFDFNKFKVLVNKALNGQDASKVIEEGKKFYNGKGTSNKGNQEKVPAKEVITPVTNNNTKAPTNSNNQQVEAPVKTPSENANQSISDFEKQVVDLTNAERAKAGLKPLEMYNPLMEVAQAKSEDMAKNNYFSHNSPTYGSPFDQIKAAGIQYRAAGENIAQGQRTPQQVVQAWMESPGHRQNIMNANYTHIGVGFVEDGYYWTQQFIQM